jgi:hypothetical protein
VTLQEDPLSDLPLGPSCVGEARLTLPCHAFKLILKNVGKGVVRLGRLACAEPLIDIERKEPRSTDGWWRISEPTRSTCTNPVWTNLRLRPGENTKYATRLVGPHRQGEFDFIFKPGYYTLRARWTLFGCTEAPEGADCLSPLQNVNPLNRLETVDLQKPVTVVSNEITIQAPSLPNLDKPRLSLRVAVRPKRRENGSPTCEKCMADDQDKLDYLVFHAEIRNVGKRAMRLFDSTLGLPIRPEYRRGAGEWKPLPQIPLDIISSLVGFQVPISPNQAMSLDFTMATLRYDTTPLSSKPGKYQFRFTLRPSACAASGDATFCLRKPEDLQTITSNTVTARIRR